MKSPFERAQEFMECATKLDDMDKSTFTPDLRARVANCVEQMHNFAIKLAGDRVPELYGPDDADIQPCEEMKLEVLEEHT